MIGRIARVTSVVAGTMALAAAPALAQQPPSSNKPHRTGFVFEVHGGSASAGALTKVFTSTLPAPGPTAPDFRGGTTRLVPSWFFGDGALLANQVSAQTLDGVSIVPLDPVLTKASANVQKGRSFGLRIGHTITSHVFAAFAYDTVSGHLAIDPGALTAITATVGSFQPYWSAVLTRPQTANVRASATSTLVDNVSSTMKLTMGEVDINVVTIHGWTPYFEIGGGIQFPSADEASVTLVGNYAFKLNNANNNNGAPFSETDQIRVRFQAQPAIIKVVGGGVEGDLMRHLGVRVDVRAMLGASRIRTRLDTAPTSVLSTPPLLGAQARGASPSLQIANNGLPTSLSLQGVNHVDTFEGAGRLVMFSVGAFFRF
jgi:hypothetical protein